jgi:hypothetical protein
MHDPAWKSRLLPPSVPSSHSRIRRFSGVCGMTDDLHALIGLPYRADWTTLSLSARLTERTDDDARARLQADSMTPRPRPRKQGDPPGRSAGAADAGPVGPTPHTGPASPAEWAGRLPRPGPRAGPGPQTWPGRTPAGPAPPASRGDRRRRTRSTAAPGDRVRRASSQPVRAPGHQRPATRPGRIQGSGPRRAADGGRHRPLSR